MAYTNFTPNAGDALAQSQPQMRGNFVSIRTILDPDNGAINFVPQVVPPVIPPTNTGLFSAVYAAPIPAVIAPPLPGFAEITVNKFDGVNNFTFPMTAADFNNPGFAYLPSGLILKWGRFLAATNVNTSSNYDVGNGIPVFNTVLSVQLSFYAIVGDVPEFIAKNLYYMRDLSTALQITVFLSAAPGAAAERVNYLAIGY
jgi:hypothetical protein